MKYLFNTKIINHIFYIFLFYKLSYEFKDYKETPENI